VDYLREWKDRHYDPNDPEQQAEVSLKRSLQKTWKKDLTSDMNQ